MSIELCTSCQTFIDTDYVDNCYVIWDRYKYPEGELKPFCWKCQEEYNLIDEWSFKELPQDEQ